MVQKKKMHAALTVTLFASFMFVQFVILRMGNQAGRGFLQERQQELVYLLLQCFAAPGFLFHAILHRVLTNCRFFRAAVGTAGVLCCIGAQIMLFVPCDSLFYLCVTFATVFFLGFLGGAVYLKLAFLTETTPHTGVCVGAAYALAVALQFSFQLQWTVQPVLSVLLALSFPLMLWGIRSANGAREKTMQEARSFLSSKELIRTVAVTFALLLFTSYYNGYIHHLQITSGYTVYNAYSWPRLLMIPTVILFGFLRDVRDGRYLPIGTLCISVFALLNALLSGRGTYQLNMCLYYIALTAAVAYYNLTFLRLAPHTAHPALWACMGRMIDSVNVIFGFLFRISERSQVTVMLIDIAMIVVVLLLMAVSGAFNLSGQSAAQPKVPTPVASPPAQDPFALLQTQHGLTPGEMRVFRELVLTEDKQTVIGERLSIKVRTVQANVTAIYRKTGVSTRSGLVQLYRDAAKS